MTKTHEGKEANSDTVLECLRRHAEDKSAEWSLVYLDNAVPTGMSVTSFRSCLAVLSKRGLYKVEDSWAWGNVKLS